MASFRFDSKGSLRSPKWLPDGTVRVDAVISRAGIFKYRDLLTGRETKEYRPADQVFSPASMKSFEHMPVTYRHPVEGLITPENRDAYAQGTVVAGSLRREDDLLVGSLHITGKDAIAALKRGELNVSAGYDQDIVKAPGTAPDGERFDAVQTNIIGNHVAIGVGSARAGNVARVRMDSAEMIDAGEPAEGIVMEELKKVLADLAVMTVKANENSARADSLDKENATLKAKISTIEAERDAAKDAATKAEKARTDSESTAVERAKERIKLEGVAERFLRTDEDKPIDMSKKTDAEIKAAITEKLTGKSMAGKDAAYVSARYDAAIEAEGSADAATTEVVVAINAPKTRNDGKPSAREEYLNRQADAWKNPAQKGQ